MLKYCKLIDEETGLVKLGAGCNDEYYQSIGMVQCDVEQSEKTLQWYLIEKCPHYTEEEKEEMERQRIAQLSLTRGDVFRGLLQAKGVTRSQIREKIDLMPEDTQEHKRSLLISTLTKLLTSIGAFLWSIRYHKH